MEVEEIQAQPCKFPRLGNGSSRATTNNNNHHHPAPDDEDQDPSCLDLKRLATPTATADTGNRLRGWHHSRIIRVSRASGGKDRHSKVLTSKGLRDRRVRLSVTTAIQFYDLQDRLGYDQPSKAVEWLIKAAADAIAELPSLNNSSFPDTPKQLSDEKRALSCEHGFDSADVELDGHGHHHHDLNYQHQNPNQNQSQHLSLPKSACSSTSETSKGSGLSLSRPDIRVNRVKARERARERAAKDKEKESNESASRIAHEHHQNNNMSNSISQNDTFTALLTGGIGNNNNDSPGASAHHQGGGGEPILFQKPAAAAVPMDYFSSGLLGLSSSARNHHSSGFSGQIHLGMNSIPQTMSVVSPFNVSGDHHHHQHHHHSHNSELQHFSFVPDHLIPVATTLSQPANGGGDYNLNFSISSSSGGLNAGINRGTLQSNSSSSPSFLAPHYLQRFNPIDGSSNVPFFIGAAAAVAAPTMENHQHQHHNHHQQQHQQQFPAVSFDRRLQQLYGDGTRHSDHKGKAKN